MTSPQRNSKGHWLPGSCPNPGGRPPTDLTAEIRRSIGEGGEHAVAILWRLAQGYELPTRDAQGREVVDAEGRVSLARVPSLELQAACAKWLIERAFGRAVQNVAVRDSRGPGVDLSKLTTEQVMQFRELFRALLPSGDK